MHFLSGHRKGWFSILMPPIYAALTKDGWCCNSSAFIGVIVSFVFLFLPHVSLFDLSVCSFVCRRKRIRQCYRRRCNTWDRTTCDYRRRARQQQLSSGSSQSGSFTRSTRNPEWETQVPRMYTPPGHPLAFLSKTPRWWTPRRTKTITSLLSDQDSLKKKK